MGIEENKGRIMKNKERSSDIPISKLGAGANTSDSNYNTCKFIKKLR